MKSATLRAEEPPSLGAVHGPVMDQLCLSPKLGVAIYLTKK